MFQENKTKLDKIRKKKKRNPRPKLKQENKFGIELYLTLELNNFLLVSKELIFCNVCSIPGAVLGLSLIIWFNPDKTTFDRWCLRLKVSDLPRALKYAASDDTQLYSQEHKMHLR